MKTEKYFEIDRRIVQRMIDATKTMTYEKSGDNSFQSTKVFLFDEYAVLKMQNITFRNVVVQDPDLKHLERLAGTLLRLHAEGVNVVPILAFISAGAYGYIIQKRARGLELYDRNMTNDKDYILDRVEHLSNAPQEHFDKFIKDAISIINAGVLIDFIGKDNFFYHEAIGFQFIDLNTHFDYEYGLSYAKTQADQLVTWNCFVPCYYDTVPKYRDTVSSVLYKMSDHERLLLYKHNKIIFDKCKTAMIKSGINNGIINGIVSNESFIPQKQILGLI